ncbi:short chain dehydrogenase [Pseudomonas sp. C1C7]|uniref:short chain dehydrogenase n=1 Tax=Pseudomonas sp. C1C7 TaxID=2735272 RepID=UPI00158618A9|nr:short chain dehydrogenase [Pseudomonas sp. C1C7]NUT77778.1 short chain dehydrogenase [Pseudomonas sp. C1C7]
MIAPATGMKPGERYVVDSVERAHHFPGFFLDGKYYLGPELQTAVGWLEGQQFFYDQLDPTGEPVFPGRIAGIVEDLTLTLGDGARLELSPEPFRARVDIALARIDARPLQTFAQRPSPLLVAAAALLVGGCLLLINRIGGRNRQR